MKTYEKETLEYIYDSMNLEDSEVYASGSKVKLHDNQVHIYTHNLDLILRDLLTINTILEHKNDTKSKIMAVTMRVKIHMDPEYFGYVITIK